MTAIDEILGLGCELPQAHLAGIQAGTMRYSYRGVTMYKNPFDIALYSLLLFQAKPRTIFEIGSNAGGSALWLADTMRSFEVDCRVHSIDIEPPALDVPGVQFHRGDGRKLEAILSAEFLRSLPHPFLVIEDADHHAETTCAVLRFFDPWLRAGEYIVVEDGIVDDLFPAAITASLNGGPRRGIADFFALRGRSYMVDRDYCDYFGRNVTWNVNGFLRKIA